MTLVPMFMMNNRPLLRFVRIFSMLLVVAFVSFVPLFVGAQETESTRGFVTCTGPDCDFCDFVTMGEIILGWLITLAVIISTIILAVAGLRMVMARGNPQALNQAKDSLLNIIIGIFIVAIAFTLVDTLMKVLVGGSFGPWNQVSSGMCGGSLATGEADYGLTLSPEEVEGLPDVTEGADEDITVVVTGSSATVNGVDLSVNSGMGPIFDPKNGGSSMVRPGAANRMKFTLVLFGRLQQAFGRKITINDAIAKAGTSRETQTTGSRHFYGDALDLSIAGMSNSDKLRLLREAKKVGFTGFGLGAGILHIDLGAKRSWSYGNSTYGGQPIEMMKAEARR